MEHLFYSSTVLYLISLSVYSWLRYRRLHRRFDNICRFVGPILAVLSLYSVFSATEPKHPDNLAIALALFVIIGWGLLSAGMLGSEIWLIQKKHL